MSTVDIVDFLAFATESYRFHKKMTGAEVDDLFTNLGVYDFIVDNFDILHSFGEKRILFEINEYIKSHSDGN